MICKKCGERNPNGAKYCKGCGSQLISPEKETKDAHGASKGRKKWPAALAAAVAAAVVATGTTASVYKNTFRRQAKEFQELQQTYALGQYETEYDRLNQEAETVLGGNHFFDISEVRAGMSELADRIIGWNEQNAEKFGQQYALFQELEKKEVLGTYEKEYKALQKEAEGYYAASDYIGIDKVLEPMQELRTSIIDMNTKVAEYKTVYDDTVKAFQMLYLSKDEKDDYESYRAALEDALGQFDVSACEAASATFTGYQQKIEQDNIKEIEHLKDDVKAFDTEELFDVETDEFEKHVKEAQNSYGDKNYAKAYKNYLACKKQIGLVEKSYSYNANLEQVDVSEFPEVKLYLSIKDFATGSYVDNLDPDSFRLREALSGGKYRKPDILSADKMDGKEKLNIAMVADCSASMGYNFSYGQDIMEGFLQSMQTGAGDQAALYSFADYVDREMYFTSDTDALSDAIYDMEMGNMTALYDALVYALSEIVVQDGAKCVIAFTDGMENYSTSTKEFVIRKANENHVPIYLIGIGGSVDDAALRDIAESTGGFYANIDDISYMEDIYDQIYRDQKSMYVVRYRTDEKESTDVGRSVYVSYQDETYAIRMQDEYTPSEYKIQGFIFYDSDSRYLTEEELDRLTEVEVLIALNEIYARRGYIFSTNQALISHFNSCSWYNGTEGDMLKVAGTFNEYETKNVDLLVNYECKHGLNNRKK